LIVITCNLAEWPLQANERGGTERAVIMKTNNNHVILCHKCSGFLTAPNDSRLYSCGCISGWVRGFEKALTSEEAVVTQIKAGKERLDLYAGQGRSEDDTVVKEMRAKLKKLES
jgi:hypothetical protein